MTTPVEMKLRMVAVAERAVLGLFPDIMRDQGVWLANDVRPNEMARAVYEEIFVMAERDLADPEAGLALALLPRTAQTEVALAAIRALELRAKRPAGRHP